METLTDIRKALSGSGPFTVSEGNMGELPTESTSCGQALLLYCTTGRGIMRVDTEEYAMRERDCLFVLPYKMLGAHSVSTDARVICFAFCREILSNVMTGIPTSLVLYIRRHPLISLSDNDSAFIQAMTRQLDYVGRDERQIYASRIVSNIISNFLMINYGALSVSEMADSPVYCRSEELFKQFLTDTEKFYNKYHCVADYARRLCISTKYLTQIARAKTGMSPKELIDEVTLRRALTLLKDSNKSVKEISIDCGFPNPGYFSRFIKRMMGITPQEFREERRVKNEE